MNKNHDPRTGRFAPKGSTSSLSKGATVRIIHRSATDGSVVGTSKRFKVGGVAKDKTGYGINPATGKHWDAGRAVTAKSGEGFLSKNPAGQSKIRVETTKLNIPRAREAAALRRAANDTKNNGMTSGLRGEQRKQMAAVIKAKNADNARSSYDPKGVNAWKPPKGFGSKA